MSKENGGRGGIILNVSSLAALDVYSFMPSYSASKHGIIGLQRCLSVSSTMIFIRILLLNMNVSPR